MDLLPSIYAIALLTGLSNVEYMTNLSVLVEYQGNQTNWLVWNIAKITHLLFLLNLKELDYLFIRSFLDVLLVFGHNYPLIAKYPQKAKMGLFGHIEPV